MSLEPGIMFYVAFHLLVDVLQGCDTIFPQSLYHRELLLHQSKYPSAPASSHLMAAVASGLVRPARRKDNPNH